MSANTGPEFVDTNVLVYAFDASAGRKHFAARALLERLWNERMGCLSIQVLQEFFVTITHKVVNRLSVDEAAARIHEFTVWNVFSPDSNDVLAAIALHKKAQLSFWDAMVVHAAAEIGCRILWTEDMSSGQILEGVEIRNPFAADRAS